MNCGRVKNPCKICFQSVSNKNGLQCKGACKKWAHYKCLNFTPGKISDVKAGIIKITCPCPNCSTGEPKEMLTNPPYTCTKTQCPANNFPSCESVDCPSKPKPIPAFEPALLTSPRPESPKQLSPISAPIPEPTKVVSPKCLTPPLCLPPRVPGSPQNRKALSPRRPLSPPRMPPSSPGKQISPRRSASPPRRPLSPPRTPPSPPRKPISPRRSASPPRKTCPSCAIHCPKRPQQPIADKLCSPQRSRSCSIISSNSGTSCLEPPKAISSYSGLSTAQQDQKIVFNTIEQMCDTVGQLSNQLKDLMCKMVNAFEHSNKK